MKYKVTINWHGEQIVLFTHANTETVAKINASIQLSERLGVYKNKVLRYVNSGKDCYRVEQC